MFVMKTSYAINKVGSVKELAALFGISVQAVYKWGDELPELRVYQLKNKKPEIFMPELVSDPA